MRKDRLLSFIEKIIIGNKGDILRTQTELNAFMKKLAGDDASPEILKLIGDVALYLPYIDFDRKNLPFTEEYLKKQIEAGKRIKAQYDSLNKKTQETSKSHKLYERLTVNQSQETQKKQETKAVQKEQHKKNDPATQAEIYSIMSHSSVNPQYLKHLAENLDMSDPYAMNVLRDADRGCYR